MIADPLKKGNLNILDNENYIIIKAYHVSGGCLTKTAKLMGVTIAQAKYRKERAESQYGKLLNLIDTL